MAQNYLNSYTKNITYILRINRTKLTLADILFFVLSALIYSYLFYFVNRENHLALFTGYTLLFGGLLGYWYYHKETSSLTKFVLLAIILRFIPIFAVPALTDDFYRFIWDGILLLEGKNPYMYIPSAFDTTTLSKLQLELLSNMNSPSYHSVYPPVCQGFFAIAAFIGNGSITMALLTLHFEILIAEIGSILLIRKLIKIYKVKPSNAHFYYFNPLIIIELNGSIHFEAYMIFFVLLGIYFIKKAKVGSGALSFSLGILVKLLPAMFVPLFFQRLSNNKNVKFILYISLLIIVFCIPFINKDAIIGLFKGLGLYFQKFEFNASLYHALLQVGYWFKGYYITQSASVIMPVTAMILIVGYISIEKSKLNSTLAVSMMWVMIIYIICSSTVHPWYITPMVAFGIFSKSRIYIWWSFIVFYTYIGYGPEGYTENYYVKAIEYIVLFVLIYQELKYKAKSIFNKSKKQYA